MLRTVAVSILLTLVAAGPAKAQLFLQVVGQTQGSIAGGSTYPGEEGKIEVTSFSQGNTVYFGQGGSGVLSRSRGSLVLSKQWDPSSLKLLRAEVNEELLTTCTLRIYRPAPKMLAGKRMPMVLLIIELTNARVESFSTSGSAGSNASESVTFTFDAIRYTYPDTGETWNEVVRPEPPAKPTSAGGAEEAIFAAQRRDPFEFVLPQDGFVGIEIRDADGRRVTTLFDGDAAESDGVVRWDATDESGNKVAAGVYTAMVRTAGAEITRYMVVGD